MILIIVAVSIFFICYKSLYKTSDFNYLVVIMETLTKSDIILLNEILTWIPLHTFFSIENAIKHIDNSKIQLVFEHYTGVNDLRIRDFLVENGFAIKDSKGNIELTNQGKNLKKAGSYENYIKQIQQYKKEKNWNKIGVIVAITVGLICIIIGLLQLLKSK